LLEAGNAFIPVSFASGNAETDDTITLKITDTLGQVLVNHAFTDTPQDDLERAQANFYYADVTGAIIRTNLTDSQSSCVSTEMMPGFPRVCFSLAWMPSRARRSDLSHRWCTSLNGLLGF
jgi:hypothetical protein